MKNPFHALKLRPKRPSASMIVAGLALFVGLGGGAYAATQINGNQIQDGTISSKKLTLPAQGILNHSVGAHWGVIDRNTIGSAVADLRAGPYGSFAFTGRSAQPPSGVGSLGIQVSDNATSGSPAAEKVAFGNEVDFLGNPVSGLSDVGFRVFQTSENAAINPRNMPNITLEINPRVVGAGSYTSMVWVPMRPRSPTGGPAISTPPRPVTGTSPGPPARSRGATRRRCARSRPRRRRWWTTTTARPPASTRSRSPRVATTSGSAPWMTCASTTRSTTSSPTGSTDQLAVDPSRSGRPSAR